MLVVPGHTLSSGKGSYIYQFVLGEVHLHDTLALIFDLAREYRRRSLPVDNESAEDRSARREDALSFRDEYNHVRQTLITTIEKRIQQYKRRLTKEEVTSPNKRKAEDIAAGRTRREIRRLQFYIQMGEDDPQEIQQFWSPRLTTNVFLSFYEDFKDDIDIKATMNDPVMAEFLGERMLRLCDNMYHCGVAPFLDNEELKTVGDVEARTKIAVLDNPFALRESYRSFSVTYAERRRDATLPENRQLGGFRRIMLHRDSKVRSGPQPIQAPAEPETQFAAGTMSGFTLRDYWSCWRRRAADTSWFHLPEIDAMACCPV